MKETNPCAIGNQPLSSLSADVPVFNCFCQHLVRKISSLLIFAGPSFKFRFIPLQFSLSKSQLTFVSLPFLPFYDLTNSSRQGKHKMILIHRYAVIHRKVKTSQANSLPTESLFYQKSSLYSLRNPFQPSGSAFSSSFCQRVFLP